MPLRLGNVFILGATGYLGSQFLFDLSRSETHKTLRIKALVRTITPEKEAKLKSVYPCLQVIEGDLDDEDLIKEEASNSDIVINCANADHWPSVRGALAGLERRSSQHPGDPPLYIHISGIGLISDNSNGEDGIEPHEYSDIDFRLDDLPPTNIHLECDIPIVQAGTRMENPIRTVILIPGWVYGVGEGIQKLTLALRLFLNLVKQAGFVGTCGNGCNVTSNIHVKDVSSAIMVLLDAARDGKIATVGAGLDNLYFATGPGRAIPHKEVMARFGDMLYYRGIAKLPGTRPYPDRILASIGHGGRSLLGGNELARSDRLSRLGWEPIETRRKPLLDSLPDEVELILQELKDGRIC